MSSCLEEADIYNAAKSFLNFNHNSKRRFQIMCSIILKSLPIANILVFH